MDNKTCRGFPQRSKRGLAVGRFAVGSPSDHTKVGFKLGFN